MTQIHSMPQPLGLAQEIDDRLTRFFAERIALSARYGSEYRRLWSSVAASCEGGKRLRPRFVVSAFRSRRSAEPNTRPLSTRLWRSSCCTPPFCCTMT